MVELKSGECFMTVWTWKASYPRTTEFPGRRDDDLSST